MWTSIITLIVMAFGIGVWLYFGPTDEEVKECWKDDFIHHLSSIHCLEMNFAYIVGVAEKNYTEHFHYGLCPREAAEEELTRFKLKRGIKK